MGAGLGQRLSDGKRKQGGSGDADWVYGFELQGLGRFLGRAAWLKRDQGGVRRHNSLLPTIEPETVSGFFQFPISPNRGCLVSTPKPGRAMLACPSPMFSVLHGACERVAAPVGEFVWRSQDIR